MAKACERDNFMSAEEAKDFGLIDHIISRQSESDEAK
ncbi:MAG TPA: ATP-dependent Clp protease proteolytic subunit [Planctomycetota bacterium]|jgi:ATP-dependent protease ClpP protease subunit|nr:ATP-dependent Clp protease proteolytic subunit [Planctomycetota bacterium]